MEINLEWAFSVFVKLVVAIPNKFHCSYDALLSLGFDSSFERSGLPNLSVTANVEPSSALMPCFC